MKYKAYKAPKVKQVTYSDFVSVGQVPSYTHVLMYFIGLAIFGLLYWIINGVVDILKTANIADTTSFTSYDILMYVWGGIVVVYLIFGGVWMVRSFQRNTT